MAKCKGCGKDLTTATEQEAINLLIKQYQDIAEAAKSLNKQLQAENEKLKAELRNSTMEIMVYFIESCIEIWPEFKNNLKENWREILNQSNNQSDNKTTNET